jgi:hypothetical protein
VVTDAVLLARLDTREDETVVEIPPRLLSYLVNDGMSGVVANVTRPIVHVTANGNYILQGARVSDAHTLGQMDIPDHETCVEVGRKVMAQLG